MSDDRFERTTKALGMAVANIMLSPAVHAFRVVGSALGKPELEGQAVAMLQEDMIRLFNLIQDHAARIDEELRSKIDGVELAEVLLQSATNMGRTASAQKRQLMQNVALNGLEAMGSEIVERRLFVQAVVDLDLLHIDFLRAAGERALVDPPPTSWRSQSSSRSSREAFSFPFRARRALHSTPQTESQSPRPTRSRRWVGAFYCISPLPPKHEPRALRCELARRSTLANPVPLEFRG